MKINDNQSADRVSASCQREGIAVVGVARSLVIDVDLLLSEWIRGSIDDNRVDDCRKRAISIVVHNDLVVYIKRDLIETSAAVCSVDRFTQCAVVAANRQIARAVIAVIYFIYHEGKIRSRQD